jgi:hypothetical protein
MLEPPLMEIVCSTAGFFIHRCQTDVPEPEPLALGRGKPKDWAKQIAKTSSQESYNKTLAHNVAGCNRDGAISPR